MVYKCPIHEFCASYLSFFLGLGQEGHGLRIVTVCDTADVDTTGMALVLIDWRSFFFFSPQALIRAVSKETSLFSVANV